jgi:hypothetical protein
VAYATLGTPVDRHSRAFVPDDEISEMMNERISTKKRRAGALERMPLHYDGIEKVKAGIVHRRGSPTAVIDGPILSDLT